MKTFLYLYSEWYEENRTFDEVLSQSDNELISNYVDEYGRYDFPLEHVVAIKTYIEKGIKGEDNIDYVSLIKSSIQYLKYDIDMDYATSQEVFGDIYELENKLKETNGMTAEEEKAWFMQNIDFFNDMQHKVEHLLELIRGKLSTLDENILNIIRKYDEFFDFIEGSDDSRLMEKSMEVSLGKTTKKQRTSIMSFSGPHRSGSLFYDVLNNDNMYCRWKGQTLRKENIGYWLWWKDVDTDPRTVEDFPYEPAPELTGENFENITFGDAITKSIYIVGESKYRIAGNRDAMAMEAYILAHSGGKGKHPSEEQIAWWNTEILENGNIIEGTEEDNSFTHEAETFQNFADKLTKKHATSNNGFNYTVPKWMSGKKTIDGNTYDFDRVSVDYNKDKNEYIVGPFSINFVRSSYGDVDFGIIENMTLVTDKYQDGIKWNKNSNVCGWKIQLEDGTICSDLGQIKGKRPFYIIVEYDKGKIDKKILNVKVGIKYMNASGNYDQLVGVYEARKYKIGGLWGTEPYKYPDNCHMKDPYIHVTMDTIEPGVTQGYEVEYVPRAEFNNNPVLVSVDNHEIYDLYGRLTGHGECKAFYNVSTDTYVHVAPGGSDPTPAEDYDEVYEHHAPTDGYGWTSVTQFRSKDIDDAHITPVYPYGELDPVGKGWNIGLADTSDLRKIDPSVEKCYIYGPTGDSQFFLDLLAHILGYSDDNPVLAPVIAIGYLGPYTETWQSLNAGIKASLWYEHYECSLISTINDSKLTVIKDMEDSNGKPIDASIKFNLNVDNEKTIVKYNENQLVVNPSKNTSVTSRVYYYQNKDGLGFTLKEEKAEGYEDYEIESIEAKDNEGKPVNVTLSDDKTTITGIMPQNGLTLHIKNKDTNQKEKNSQIQIKKKLDITNTNYPFNMETENAQSTLINYHEDNKDNVFPFRVTLSPGKESSFAYNGEHYVDSSIIDSFKNAHPEIDATKIHEGDCIFYTSVKSYIEGNESTADHKDFSVSWYEKTNAPEYHVEELGKEEIQKNEGDLARFLDESTITIIKNSADNTQNESTINERGVFVASEDRPYDANGNERNRSEDEPIVVTAINKTGVSDTEYFGNLKIIKTLDLSNFGITPEFTSENLEEYIDNKIEEYTKNNGNKPLFKFEVKVGDQSEEAQIQGSGAQKIYKNDRLDSYRWEWTSEDFKLSQGNATPYTVSELTEDGQFATSKDLFTKSGLMIVDGTAIVGLNGKQAVDDNFSSFLNRIDKEQIGLNIGKIIDAETQQKLQDKNLHFVVALDGYFAYEDNENQVLPYGYHKIRLTRNMEELNASTGYIELSKVEGSLEELDNTTSIDADDKYITIPAAKLTADGSTINDILSNQTIKYFKSDENDLKILISEETDNLDDTINSYAIKGVTSNGWTTIGEINKEENIIKEVFKNESVGTASETAMLRINKKLRGISNLTDEEKDKLEFKFNVKIAKQSKEGDRKWEAVEDRVVTLKYNDQYYGANEWNWVDDKITWDPEKYNTPVYMVQEDVSSLPEGISFEGFNVGGTYKTVERTDTDVYNALFANIAGNAEGMFRGDSRIYKDYKIDTARTYEDYIDEDILNDRIKRVSLDDYAVIGVMTPKGKSEAIDEINIDRDLGIDESVDTVDVYAENSLDTPEPTEGKIKIIKTIKSKLDEKKEFAFAVKITSGKFTLGGTEYDIHQGQELYLTKDNTLVDENTYFGNNFGNNRIPKLSKALVVRVDEESNSIESGVFRWNKGENPPTYEIECKEWYREIKNDTINNELKEYGNEDEDEEEEEFTISSKDGTTTKGGENLKGIINSEIVKIDAVNGNTSRIRVSVKLRKEYNRDEEKALIRLMYGDGSEAFEAFEKARKEELKKNTFEFDLNIIGVRKYEPVLTFDHIENEGQENEIFVYTAGADKSDNPDEYVIEIPKNASYEYEIKEKSNRGSGLTFKEFLVKQPVSENAKTSETPVYRGTLNEDQRYANELVGSAEADISAVNMLRDGGTDQGKLQIYKEITNNGGPVKTSGTLQFEVKIDKPDNIPDETVYAVYTNGDQIIRLKSGTPYYVRYVDGVETLTTVTTDRVNIPFKESASETWTMQGKIEWMKGSLAPKYTIKEDPTYTGYLPIYENGNQNTYKEGSLGDTDSNGYVKTFIENDIDEREFVYLKLEKQFRVEKGKTFNVPNTFKFKIEVEGHAEQYVTLRTPTIPATGISDLTYDYYIASDVYKYKIDTSKEYLDYKITEVELPVGARFDYLCERKDNGEEGKHIANSSQSISGRLVKTKNGNQDTALTVICVNKEGYGGDDSANLSLKKVLLGNSESNKIFKFKVKINTENAVEVVGGSIGYSLNSTTGFGYIDKNNSKEFEVDVQAGKTIELGKFKWAGSSEGGPSYVVEEIQDETGNTIKDNSFDSAKKMVKGESYQVTQYNEETTYGGYIKVHKEYDSASRQKPTNPNIEFTFDVYVYDKKPTESNAKLIREFKNNKVKASETWTSELITWKGENVPYYYVIEQENDYVPKNGENQEVGTWEATVGGELVSSKENAKQVPVLYKYDAENNQELTLGNNDVQALGYNYNNPDEIEARDIVNITNKKDEEDSVKGSFKIIKEVEAEKLGVDDDMPEDGFEIEITVSGNFELDGQTYPNGWKKTIKLPHKGTFEQELSWDKNSAPPTVTIKEIGLNQINEKTKNGVWTLDGISNNGASLIVDDTVELYVNNKFSRGFARRILYDIGGNVWEDLPNLGDKNSPNSFDGLRNEGQIENASPEEGISNVEVYVYRTVDDKLADLYTETGAPIQQPIYTDAYGRWDASLKIEDEADLIDNSFYVVFVYDGQTYEPTKLLPTGTAAEYKAASTKRRAANELIRDDWKYDSMAIDIRNSQEAIGDIQLKYNRASANEKLHYIQGKLPIDGSGKTTGTAYSTQPNAKSYNLDYNSDISSGSRDGIGTYSASRVKSTLQTTYDDGRVIDQYKVAASTKNAGLIYPFDKQLLLESASSVGDPKIKDYTKNGKKTTYRAGYPYSQHINLGLKKRSEADLYAAKDLEKATVVVNGRKLTYTFKSLAQRINKPIEIDGYFDDMYTDEQYSTTCYRIGLFKTDYYYRAELYQNNADYDELYDFYKKLMNYSNGLESTEMEAFLTYKISIYNASPTYDAHVYTINDYSEESLELVTSNVIRYIKNADGSNNVSQIESIASENNPKGEVIVDVNNPIGAGNGVLSLTALNAANRPVANISYGDTVNGSDGYRYSKTSFTLDGSGSDYYSVASGEIKDYYLTYRVKKGNFDNVSRAIKLGTKSNIVEISRYSTFDKDTTNIAGKVDRNSAPDNVNIKEYNNESRYEDDTYISRARLGLTTDVYNKKITGKAWEDMKNSNSAIGNGEYDKDSEALIGGLATELVEKVVIPSNAKAGTATDDYTEYDFLWPTNESLQVYGGKSYSSLTGFSSITETSRVEVKNEDDVVQSVGEYRFEYIPAGDYVVRFRYGVDKSNTGKSNITTGEPTALSEDGKAWATNFSRDEDKVGIYTANYYRKRYGQTPAVYNGQDYKSTIVVENNENSSKARDSESKRLEVMSNSEIITNSNGQDMYEANKTDGRHYMLHEFYDMYADSDKNTIYMFNDKNKVANNTRTGTYTYYSGSNVQATPASEDSDYESDDDISQEIPNINIGLVERPENKIVLDKEISSIRLTTNDGQLKFNAVYDLSYVVKTQEEINQERNDNQKEPIKIAKLSDGRFLVASSILNKDKSTKTDIMQQIDKVEKKLEYLGEINEGTQNFRYINMDNEVLQGLHVEIKYKIVALNIGETDYTHKCIENLSGSKTIADQMLEYAKAIRRENAKYKKNGTNIEPNGLQYGDRSTSYVDIAQKTSQDGNIGIGQYYYTGNKGNNDVPVSSRVRVVMDYVDNDAVFDTEENRKKDHYWKAVSVKELDGGGSLANRLIDSEISNGMYILDKDDRKYVIDSHKNIAMNVDTINDSTDTEGTDNGGFEMRLLPYTYNSNLISNDNVLLTNVINDLSETELNVDSNVLFKVASVLEITVIKNTSAETDADSMAYDNLAEILKYENSVGRRDMTVVPGNTNPKYGEFYISLDERDASATELITFTPPTGTFYKDVINNQLIIAITSGLAIIVLGIIIIKKKVIDVDVKNVSNSKKTQK